MQIATIAAANPMHIKYGSMLNPGAKICSAQPAPDDIKLNAISLFLIVVKPFYLITQIRKIPFRRRDR